MIFISHLLFAAYSHGNAEFMVMLPFLLPFLIEKWLIINQKVLIRIAVALFIWNMGLSVVPASRFDFYDSQRLVGLIHQQTDTKWMFADPVSICNQYEYVYGDTIYSRLIKPVDIKLEKDSVAKLKFYTDLIDRPNPMSRGSLTINLVDTSLLQKKEKVLVLNGYFGRYSIYKVEVNSSK